MGAGSGGGWGGRDAEQREQWEDSLVTRPESENELSRTNRSVRGVFVGIVPRVQSIPLRALHAHRGKKFLQSLLNVVSTTIKRAMVKFRGAREKGAMGVLECLGVSQQDTMEGYLWKKRLGRSLGSHDAARHVGGICYGNGCRQETNRLRAISCPTTGSNYFIHNRVLHQALARSLRESRIQFVVQDTWPFRVRASGQNGRVNPVRMDIATEAGTRFDNYPRGRNKALLLLIGITIVKLCARNWRMQHAMQENNSPTQSSGK